jgi:predicted secreted protein
MVEVNESDADRELDLELEGELRVSLKENPTTGFGWLLEHSGEPVCEVVSDDFENVKGEIGSGGVHHWHLRARQKGTGKIVLKYRRSWEDKPAEKTFKLTVRVE